MRQEKRTETITYIVDESYRIQYMSKALMKQFSDFEPGEICYEKFRGREKPCRNCPLAHPNRKTDLFYNEDQGKWLSFRGFPEWDLRYVLHCYADITANLRFVFLFL